ncbi:hypothetical protein [Flavobacterium soyangense]|uniref:Uncharacterized protein n=1 Tax=Flavobacterium soyangense TaxID=2023265 RepID=A0A930XVP4_9FLAO|nr:hypothetical protein [Flavobacterium soyangense]MBF2708332.1 hypothetical protein [Flavobacterium soyangense]
MKNLFLIIGVILILLNTLTGILISTYHPFNYLMVDFSILFSTFLIYLFSNSNISTGYKIGLTAIFILTGLIKIVFCLVSSPQLQDNFLMISVLGILAFEITCIISAFTMRKFS